MISKENNIQMNIKENPLILNVKKYSKGKTSKEKKNKKTTKKRFQMEKTVDDSIKKINSLLQNDVNYVIYNILLYIGTRF